MSRNRVSGPDRACGVPIACIVSRESCSRQLRERRVAAVALIVENGDEDDELPDVVPTDPVAPEHD